MTSERPTALVADDEPLLRAAIGRMLAEAWPELEIVLYSAGFLGLVALMLGARAVAIYAPRSLVSFMIASVVADTIVGAKWRECSQAHRHRQRRALPSPSPSAASRPRRAPRRQGCRADLAATRAAGRIQAKFPHEAHSMAHAIRIHKTGGPEVLQWEEVKVGDPGAGEARVAHKAVGLNYIDTYHRTGLYPLPLPSGIGLEAAGVVEAVGSGVTEFKAGDRVAYANGPIGAYSETKIHPVDRLVKIPDGISFEQAASMMLQGLTVQYLLRRLHVVPKSGDRILWHAAAGGVGLIACQWAKALGVEVIGTVSSEEKAKLARDNGCAHTVIYTKEDFVARVNEITGGKKLQIVYDSVGKDTFMKSLDCLQPRGLMVSFGNSSGAVGPTDLGILAQKGSLYVTRPTLINYTAKRDELVGAANELFDMVLKGKVKVGPRQTYPLKDAAQSHRDLEARKTTGSTVLVP